MNPQFAGTLPEPRLQSVKRKQGPKHAVSSPPAVTQTVVSDPAKVATGSMIAKKTPVEKAKSARRIKPGDLILVSWPVVVAVLLAGFAPEWHELAVSAGRWPLRFTFPYSLLLMHREIGISASMSQILPGLAIYLQVPIDGVILSFTLLRNKSLLAGIVQILVVHLLCSFVLFLLDYL